nr:20 kDa chaperonin, chloroplastic-like [Ipomoea batatas]GME16535.1 20 kDa chaperonin, chloroplastic-like [Ipomoea batatas]GME20763.1 20 kDa chaperonin, chloroplastic-like [Ipomoea batatas]
MASIQLTASTISAKGFASFDGLRSTNAVKVASFAPQRQSANSPFRGLVVRAATTVAPKELDEHSLSWTGALSIFVELP